MIFQRRVRPIMMLRELLGARELVVALTERDFRARYKQTKVGVAWALLPPVMLMVAFSIFAHAAADFDTGGVPYALYVYVALVPWTFFSNSVSAGSGSIMANMALVNKVYCPREVFPLASVGIAAVDGVISLSILGVLFAVFREAPQATSVWVPVLALVQIMMVLGVTLTLAAVVVYVRDVRHIIPMGLQFALLATPIAYGFDEIEPRWQPLISAVNPLAPIIDGYRRVVLQGVPPEWNLIGIAAAVSAIWLVGGYVVFKRLETGFADVA
ncbi:MAG: ABC transporter permease [Candidatus Limnocylindria bacterium]